jgi:hypothetical protein
MFIYISGGNWIDYTHVRVEDLDYTHVGVRLYTRWNNIMGSSCMELEKNINDRSYKVILQVVTILIFLWLCPGKCDIVCINKLIL